MRREMGPSFVLVNNRVAMLEAKRSFQLIHDGRPVISDECFAQMSCQAIAARLADPSAELEDER